MVNSKERMLLFVVLFLTFVGLYKDTDISHVLIYVCFTDVGFELTLKVNGAVCVAGKGVKKKSYKSVIFWKTESRIFQLQCHLFLPAY